MKRKLLALGCALALLLGMAAPSAAAGETVYFTAVNETVLELSDSTMPFWSNGYLYVAAALFNSRQLEVGCSYSTAKRSAVVYSRKTTDYALFFDLTKDSVDSADGYGYYPPAVFRNGTIFLPVGLVCSYFGLTYTSTKVTNGYLIRVCGEDAKLSDRTFIDSASYNMAYAYEQYQAAKTPAASERPDTQTPEDGSAQSSGGQTVRLCFRADSQQDTLAVLDALNAAQAFGTFYFTGEEIAAGGDLVRRIAASGHALGLAADGGSDVSVAEQLQSGNETLWQAAGVKTRLCVLVNADDAAAAEAELAGYRILRPQVDRSSSGLRSASAAGTLLRRISSRRGGVTVWLGNQAAAAGVRAFLEQAGSAGHRLECLRENS